MTSRRQWFVLIGVALAHVVLGFLLGLRIGLYRDGDKGWVAAGPFKLLVVKEDVPGSGAPGSQSLKGNVNHGSSLGTNGKPHVMIHNDTIDNRRPAAEAERPALLYRGQDGLELPIRRDSFLYLSMGSDAPNIFTYTRSCYTNSAVIFLTFKTPIKLDGSATCNFTSVFFPNSTWTTGRNHLLQQAFALESNQGWRFEFFIFTDNDVYLATFHHGKDAEQLFRDLLMKYRPLRAGVRYGSTPLPPLNIWAPKCGRACYTDACVDAYHRTGLDLILPWNPVFDKSSWYMSAYIVNLLLGAIAPQYCHVYRQIIPDYRFAHAGKYPKGKDKGMDSSGEWESTRKYVNELLVRNNVPGFESGSPLLSRISEGVFGKLVNGTEEECVAQDVDVDYTKLVRHRVHVPDMMLQPT